MSLFLGWIDCWYGRATAEAAGRYFDRMRLPLPQENEFTLTDDQGLMLFLNGPACVLRFTRKTVGDITHPRILQPLGATPVGKLRAALNPGIVCPVDEQQRVQLVADLGRDNIQFADPGLYNAGTLPAPAGFEIPEGYSVVVDSGAVHDLSSATSLVKRWLGKTSPARAMEGTPQDMLHGKLRAAFAQACPAGTETASPQKMQSFWRQCFEAKAGGALVASWLTPEMARYNYKNSYKGSKLYEQRCVFA